MGPYGAHMGPYGAHMGPYTRKFPKNPRKFLGIPRDLCGDLSVGPHTPPETLSWFATGTGLATGTDLGSDMAQPAPKSSGPNFVSGSNLC